MKHSLYVRLAAGAALLFAALAMTAPSNAAEAVEKGDQVIVTLPNAPLMRGWDTLATLSQGQRLNVLERRGDWVGTSTVVNGKTVTGWVRDGQVATPSQYAAQRRTRRSYSYQPSATVASPPVTTRRYSGSSSNNNGFIMGATPYGPSYWRADRKIKGY